jgi:hypothetical protein
MECSSHEQFFTLRWAIFVHLERIQEFFGYGKS